MVGNMIYCNKCKAYNSEYAYYSKYIYDKETKKAIGFKVIPCCAKCGSKEVERK